MLQFVASLCCLLMTNADYDITWSSSIPLPYPMIARYTGSIVESNAIYIFGDPNNGSDDQSIWKFDGIEYNMVGLNPCKDPFCKSTVVQDVIYAPYCNSTLFGFNTTTSHMEYNIRLEEAYWTLSSNN